MQGTYAEILVHGAHILSFKPAKSQVLIQESRALLFLMTVSDETDHLLGHRVN
jgi:hypothetical protein